MAAMDSVFCDNARGRGHSRKRKGAKRAKDSGKESRQVSQVSQRDRATPCDLRKCGTSNERKRKKERAKRSKKGTLTLTRTPFTPFAPCRFLIWPRPGLRSLLTLLSTVMSSVWSLSDGVVCCRVCRRVSANAVRFECCHTNVLHYKGLFISRELNWTELLFAIDELQCESPIGCMCSERSDLVRCSVRR